MSVQVDRTARTKALWPRSTKAKGPGRRWGRREKGRREKAGDKTSFIAGSDRKIKVASLMVKSSDGKESVCNVGDLGFIPGSGRSPGEGNGNSLQYSRESHGQRSLAGYSLRGHKESDTPE